MLTENVEPHDCTSLMFQLTLIPFGGIESPKLSVNEQDYITTFFCNIICIFSGNAVNPRAQINFILVKIGKKIITNVDVKNKILTTLIIAGQENNQ